VLVLETAKGLASPQHRVNSIVTHICNSLIVCLYLGIILSDGSSTGVLHWVIPLFAKLFYILHCFVNFAERLAYNVARFVYVVGHIELHTIAIIVRPVHATTALNSNKTNSNLFPLSAHRCIVIP